MPLTGTAERELTRDASLAGGSVRSLDIPSDHALDHAEPAVHQERDEGRDESRRAHLSAEHEHRLWREVGR